MSFLENFGAKMSDRPKNPFLKVKSGPSPTRTGVSNAVTEGLASPLSAMSKAADLMPMASEQLRGFLHFRLASAQAARSRASWIGGRLYNKFSGETPDYVPLSGTQLRQAFLAMRVETPAFVVARGEYELRIDYAEKALAALNEDKKRA